MFQIRSWNTTIMIDLTFWYTLYMSILNWDTVQTSRLLWRKQVAWLWITLSPSNKFFSQAVATSVRFQKQISFASPKTGFYNFIREGKIHTHTILALTNFDRYFNIQSAGWRSHATWCAGEWGGMCIVFLEWFTMSNRTTHRPAFSYANSLKCASSLKRIVMSSKYGNNLSTKQSHFTNKESARWPSHRFFKTLWN